MPESIQIGLGRNYLASKQRVKRLTVGQFLSIIYVSFS